MRARMSGIAFHPLRWAAPLLLWATSAAMAQEPVLFAGGGGRGDARHSFAALSQPLFAGGTGRGDARLVFAGPQQPLFAGGIGNGDALTTFEGPVDQPFAGGAGRGDARTVTRALGGLPFAGGSGRGDVRSSFAGTRQPMFAGGDGRGDVTFAFTLTLPTEVFLSLRAVLSGPYDAATGLMGDALRALPDFPATEPYTALGYVHVGGGGEVLAPGLLSIAGPDAVVDWVVVELRSSTDPATVLATRSALLQRDGDVVDAASAGALRFQLPADAYRVALRHRNHLGTLAALPVQLGAATFPLDLAAPAMPVFGTEARVHVSGAFPAEALWAGDVSFDGVIRYTGAANDRDPVLFAIGGSVPTNTTSGYLQVDVNLNGIASYTGPDNDRDRILQSIGGSMPTNTRVEQLP